MVGGPAKANGELVDDSTPVLFLDHFMAYQQRL